MTERTSFHFDLGNSSQGPIGMCARVVAPSREVALEALKAALPEEIRVEPLEVELPPGVRIEYINVYTNDAHIGLADSHPSSDEAVTAEDES